MRRRMPKPITVAIAVNAEAVPTRREAHDARDECDPGRPDQALQQ
jgi:hypothetical protein